MPTRRAPTPPPGPPELTVEPDRAREIVNGLIQEGHELMATTIVTTPEQFEQWIANCKRWSNKGFENLRRMWDQDSYAETFAWGSNYSIQGAFWQSLFQRAHQALRTQIHDLEQHLDKIDIASSGPKRSLQPAEAVPPARGTNVFNIQSVGNLTIADRVRDIKSTVHNVTGSSAEDIQRITEAFADLLSRDPSITDEQREDALDQLKTVADGVAKPGAQSRGVLRGLVGQLGLIAKASTALNDMYNQWHPVVQPLLEHHH